MWIMGILVLNLEVSMLLVWQTNFLQVMCCSCTQLEGICLKMSAGCLCLVRNTGTG